jgi:hypothetical protein
MMKKYGLPASDTSVAKWAIDIANDTLDPAALEEMIKTQAKAKYPHLADMIDRGVTPDDYYQPFKQTIAQELEGVAGAPGVSVLLPGLVNTEIARSERNRPTPATAAPPTATAARSDAPPAQGGGAGNFFKAEARKPDAAPVRPIQGKPGTGAGTLGASKSTASATAAKSAFDEATTKPSTVAAVLEERKNAATSQEAISAEQIARTGGGDASQITTKITGVVATDNRQIVIRGLNDRYNIATLNGAELPSADPRRRAPQLDMIPAAMIDRVVVSKTFTPDLQGGFAGGAVNIVTKSFPAQGFTTVSAGTGLNSSATMNEGFLKIPGGGTDLWALDDGSRALPSKALIDPSIITELMAAETYLCFGPDTLAEARNRCYKPYKGNGSGLADAD